PKAEKAQGRPGQDCDAETQGRDHHDRGGDVGENVTGDDPPVPAAGGSGHLEILIRADGQDGASDDAGVAGGAPDTQGQDHAAQPLAQHGHDRQEDDEPGEGHQRVDAPREDGVDAAAVVAGHDADDDGQERADGHGAEPEEHRDARPVNDPAQDVASEV